jgi:hypothetical protein
MQLFVAFFVFIDIFCSSAIKICNFVTIFTKHSHKTVIIKKKSSYLYKKNSFQTENYSNYNNPQKLLLIKF